MSEKVRFSVIDRRDFLLGAGGVVSLTALMRLGIGSATAASWQDALKEVIGDAKPAEGKVSLGLPEIAENGNTVPFSVDVDSPMTSGDHVKSVHVFATGNPNPHVVSLNFTTASGKASAKSRMRLGKTQDVLAVAELSDGKFYMGRRTVKVTIGGCGG